MVAFGELVNFVLDPVYFRILYLTLMLFIAGWIIWSMYITLSKRDLFKLTHPKDMDDPKFLDKATYALKYIFFFPVFTFMWYVLFVACLKILSGKENLEEIMLLGIVIVSAVRIAAYASQKMAEDVAKLLPLTLLAGILLNPSFISLDANLDQLNALFVSLPSFGKYLLFIITLEFILRVGRRIFLNISVSKNTSKTQAKQQEA